MIVDRGERGATGAKRPQGARFIEADPALIDALREQQERFREKFGRDPAPDDPIFFDPDADEPRPMRRDGMTEMFQDVMRAMRMAGIDPALIYAYDKTDGMLPVAGREHLWTPHELDEWQTYGSEYMRVAAWIQEMRDGELGFEEDRLEEYEELYALDHVENDDDLSAPPEQRSPEYVGYAEEFKRVIAWMRAR